jgi:hypothetical protein
MVLIYALSQLAGILGITIVEIAFPKNRDNDD